MRDGTVKRVRDLGEDHRFPSYGPRAAECGARSVLSLPLAADGRTVGALNLYSRDPDVFDGDGLALGELLAAHASLAVQAATAFYSSRAVAEQLREAISSRAVIEQAKGALMSQHRCDADKAFKMLVTESQQTNRKLRLVAQDVIDAIS
jgi:GAF domain-containing protein